VPSCCLQYPPLAPPPLPLPALVIEVVLCKLCLCNAGPGKVPVHYFGTQEFAWMKGKDVVSFGQGLQRGMHLCKASNRSKAAFQRALHEVSVYFLVGDVHHQTLPASADMTINIVFGLHYPLMLNIEYFDLWA